MTPRDQRGINFEEHPGSDRETDQSGSKQSGRIGSFSSRWKTKSAATGLQLRRGRGVQPPEDTWRVSFRTTWSVEVVS
jgi:hypothetical protein